jgi:hypothetical protein
MFATVHPFDFVGLSGKSIGKEYAREGEDDNAWKGQHDGRVRDGRSGIKS